MKRFQCFISGPAEFFRDFALAAGVDGQKLDEELAQWFSLSAI